MDKIVFIDANIYLKFYETNSSKFNKLLVSLVEIKDYIFITKQLEDEIERNKLGVFIRSFVEFTKSFSIKNLNLPEHLDKETGNESKKWNEAVDEIYKNIKVKSTLLSGISEKLIDKISKGTDEVSITINMLTSKARAATPAQLERARDRKERGNPPGKRADPLGDQISFEQLLEELSSKKELWIITNDSDFFYEYDSKIYLNPLLSKEIKKINPAINIRCYKEITEGLRAFSGATNVIKSLPKKEELDKIADEEKKLNVFLTGVSGSQSGRSGYSGLSGSFGMSADPFNPMPPLYNYPGYSGYSGHSGYSGPNGPSGSGDNPEEQK